MEQENLILEQNIRLHQVEAYFYNSIHPEDFNLWEQRRLKREIEQLSKDIDRSLPVLDLASGTGNVATHLANNQCYVIACDLSIEMLKENHAKHKIRCDISKLPFRSGCFSAITAYSVLHHLPNPSEAFNEVTRVAAPQCTLYFDHDHFFPSNRRTIGHYDFTFTDIIGWILWLAIRPKQLWRLAQYAFWGRKKHLENMNALLEAENHDRVSAKQLTNILESSGFIVSLTKYKNGSYLKASRCHLKRQEK